MTAKKGAIFDGEVAPRQVFSGNEPFSLLEGWCSFERPGAVKGGPLLGAAKASPC